MSAPPPYDHAVTQPANQRGQPALNVTNPFGETHRANSADALNDTGNLQRMRSNDSTASSDGGFGMGEEPNETRRSMDDEMRDLPKGWVRCFDPNTEHHFYVDESTKRSSWIHPYDDPEFLRSLPDTHPANPRSAQAQAVQKHAEDEKRLLEKQQNDKRSAAAPVAGNKTGTESRNWIQRQTDKVIGTKEERAKHKEEKRRIRAEMEKRQREAEAAYIKRRQELIQKRLNDPNIQSMYASDPYGYSAPSSVYSRSGGLYSSPYGYGYGGGYGRRGYGYGGYGGGMGMGLPLMGGMAGGLMLGSMMGGGYGGMGGGCGGGGFGGGGGGCGGGGGGF